MLGAKMSNERPALRPRFVVKPEHCSKTSVEKDQTFQAGFDRRKLSVRNQVAGKSLVPARNVNSPAFHVAREALSRMFADAGWTTNSDASLLPGAPDGLRHS